MIIVCCCCSIFSWGIQTCPKDTETLYLFQRTNQGSIDIPRKMVSQRLILQSLKEKIPHIYIYKYIFLTILCCCFRLLFIVSKTCDIFYNLSKRCYATGFFFMFFNKHSKPNVFKPTRSQLLSTFDSFSSTAY